MKRRKQIREEVTNMGKDYLCLACGNHFLVAAAADTKCSRCGSANVLTLSKIGMVGSPAGG